MEAELIKGILVRDKLIDENNASISEIKAG